ncbi:formate dehydrogenase, partial [Methylobacterium indicum]|uniref:molybdopterin-dependent oxidoreductase n=1 Tax=Methylobacterium indicum TaxID=1775910 RepID=UPI000791AC11
AGTQDFKSVEDADVILVIGANPTDGHPVFGSRMKKRLRQGAKLIVADPRRIDLVKSPHIKATHHLPVKPGSNVALVNALAHVIVTEGLIDEAYVRERCDLKDFEIWARFIADERHAPEAVQELTGCDPAEVRAAARLYAKGGAAAIYYGLGVTEHSQGSTMVMGMANLTIDTGNNSKHGPDLNQPRGQNNVQGPRDMGQLRHELIGWPHPPVQPPHGPL